MRSKSIEECAYDRKLHISSFFLLYAWIKFFLLKEDLYMSKKGDGTKNLALILLENNLSLTLGNFWFIGVDTTTIV